LRSPNPLVEEVMLLSPRAAEPVTHAGATPLAKDAVLRQEPLKQRTYHSDDFVLAPVVGMMAH
jgi:hypothetical protein